VFRKNFFLVTVFVVIGGFFCFQGVLAQLKVGYVDSQKVLSSVPAAVDAQRKLEEESAKWGQELQKMNEELQIRQEQLEQQGLMLSEAKKREKTQEIQELYIKAQQFQNEKWGENGEFFKRRQELLQPVFDEINAAINKIAEEENYDFIYDTVPGGLLYAKQKYDLTNDVITELEKEVPSETSDTGR
jgi:outer membrane protein